MASEAAHRVTGHAGRHTGSAASGGGDPIDAAGLREMFDRWATSDHRASAVQVPRTSLGSVALADLIRSLHDDHTPLRDDTAEALCLPTGATYAGAAFLLWWAREADGGPGVRSYRAAAFLLADLDDLIRDRLLDLGHHPHAARPSVGDTLEARGMDVRGLLDLGGDDALERDGAFAHQ